jgi:ABC-type sugar transport system ATPase subunit
VAENIFANRQPVNKFGVINTTHLHKQTQQMLEMFGLDTISPTALTKYLPIAEQQVIEILKALSLSPKVLILDEPTSSLTKREKDYLFQNITRLKDQGVSIIYISHHLSEIFEICDTVTILKDGELVCDADVKEIDEEFLVTKMVGREIVDIYHYEKCYGGDAEAVLSVNKLSRKGYFEDISFSVKPGEIVGFYGLVGAGRTEVGRAIFGADPFDSGEIMLEGESLSVNTPRQAILHKIGYMSEDRKLQGLYLRMAIKANIISSHLADFARSGILSEKAIEKQADQSVKDFSIITPSIDQMVGNLSGGNQQKVLLSAWFGIRPKVLIVDEPTGGLMSERGVIFINFYDN